MSSPVRALREYSPSIWSSPSGLGSALGSDDTGGGMSDGGDIGGCCLTDSGWTLQLLTQALQSSQTNFGSMQQQSVGAAKDISFDGDRHFPPPSGEGVISLGYHGWPARHLLLSFHRIFLDRRGNGRLDLVAESTKLRGIIFWCLSSINVEAPGPEEPEASRKDENIFNDGLTDFYHVWTLAESLLLDPSPLPAARLLQWLQSYMQSAGEALELEEAKRMAREADEHGGSAELTPMYWDAVRVLVVSAMPKRAEQMLRCYPDGDDNAREVGALSSQLKKMPVLPLTDEAEDSGDGSAAAQIDRQGFLEDWIRWQKSCKAEAASFGVVPGVGGERVGDGRDGDARRQLRWLWGVLCGVRSCLEEATGSWVQLFAAVLAFERPDVRPEGVGALLRDCKRKYNPVPEEEFLVQVIQDASSGIVSSIKKFARERGDTAALSSCAAHLIDLLFRAQVSSVTSLSRSWYFQRLAERLRAFPGGGWELAATYLGEVDGGDAKLLMDLAHAVVPASERAAHELVEWCRVKGLGAEAAAAVCRARGGAWLHKTGFPAVAWGAANEEQGHGDGDGNAKDGRVTGACGKAVYWLAKGGAKILLERLFAEVSERLMVEVLPSPGADIEAQKAVIDEAEGVLAAAPRGNKGTELSFLDRYMQIAYYLLAESESQATRFDGMAGANARLAGFCAVEMLAPRGSYSGTATLPGSRGFPSHSPLLPRTWAHLLRLALPVLEVPPRQEANTENRAVGSKIIDLSQVHVLLARMQTLATSEHRVGTECGGRATSTLPAAPAPYGFRGGEEEVLRIRTALVSCLARAMMAKNREEAARGVGGGRRRKKMSDSERLPPGALITPRAAVGMPA